MCLRQRRRQGVGTMKKALVILLILSLSLANILLLQLGGPARDRQLDADSAGFMLLVNDIVTGAGKFSDWYLEAVVLANVLERGFWICTHDVGWYLHFYHIPLKHRYRIGSLIF